MLFLPLFPPLSLLLAQTAASDTHQQLVALAAAGDGLIRLDSSSYSLLTSPHRDWSASIEFTALDTSRGCVLCEEFHASWTAVVSAWAKAPRAHRDRHFFATLDFDDDDQSVFQALGLTSGPIFQTYPATEGPRATGTFAPSTHALPPGGFGAEQLAQLLSSHTPIPIPYAAPFDWRRWAAHAAALFAFAASLRIVLPILQSRWTWALGTVLPSIILTSGYMFTHIQSSPFVGPDGGWIARGPRKQFGQEVLVVAVFYGILGSGFLVLIMLVPYQSPRRQRFQVYLWSAIILLCYSVLVVFFKSKNRGYPFRLLL